MFHWVDNGVARGTLQLGQPAWIAEATGVPVVSDLQARDVAAELAMPAAAKEAYAFAVLGFLTVHGLGGTVPSCTGADHSSVLGSVTPGPTGLPTVSGEARPPVRLLVE